MESASRSGPVSVSSIETGNARCEVLFRTYARSSHSRWVAAITRLAALLAALQIATYCIDCLPYGTANMTKY